MMKKMRRLIERFAHNRFRKGVILALALIVTFVSTYTLVLPAITLEKASPRPRPAWT